MVDIQYSIAIMGGREVSRPYQVWFFAEGDLFFYVFVSVPQYLSTERFSEDSNRFVKGDKTRHIQMCINKKRLARFEHC